MIQSQEALQKEKKKEGKGDQSSTLMGKNNLGIWKDKFKMRFHSV